MQKITVAIAAAFVVFAAFGAYAVAADRSAGNVRVGAATRAAPTARMPAMPTGAPAPEAAAPVVVVAPTAPAGDCRALYRECMDQFCLLDATEGERCGCSDVRNDSAIRRMIEETDRIQAEAERIYREDVEREELGARASEVFGDSPNRARRQDCENRGWIWNEARRTCRRPGILNQTDDFDEIDDNLFGSHVHRMAHDSCKAHLESCPGGINGNESTMATTLYERQIATDCRNFRTYLEDQRRIAQNNMSIAQAAVRAKRVEHWDRNNRFNHPQCFAAYTDCMRVIAGCGDQFENCICDEENFATVTEFRATDCDRRLLTRRQESCDHILEECQRHRTAVKQQFDTERDSIISRAKRFVAENFAHTCLSRTWACLEDNCAYSTNVQCLNSINIAAGICPIIQRCDDFMATGGARAGEFKSSIEDRLGALATKVCEDDVARCLRNRCGEDFGAPECIGRSPLEVAALCPQNMLLACRTQSANDFGIIREGTLWRLEYQLEQGCINRLAERLGEICAPDMVNCVASWDVIDRAQSLAELLENASTTLIQEHADAEVAAIFAVLESDSRIDACAGNTGGRNVGDRIFTSARLAAQMQAKNRLQRQFWTKRAELSRDEDATTKRSRCENNEIGLDMGTRPTGDRAGNWISSMVFEEALMNCRVTRVQRVCATSGQSQASAALKAGAGLAAGGAGAGAMLGPWGAIIGGVVGGAGGAIAGARAGGFQTNCQDIESIENFAM